MKGDVGSESNLLKLRSQKAGVRIKKKTKTNSNPNHEEHEEN